MRELARRYGYKQETIQRYTALFGDDTENLLKANDASPKTYLRVNTLKISKAALKERLEKKGVELREVEHGFLVTKSDFSLSSTPEYILGYFYLQGIAEMQIAPLLNPEKIVIDMCAAPGGKTTHLAQLMENKGVIIALDVNEEKVKALKGHIHRLGVTNTIVYVRSSLHFSYETERILLDAPCTGSGIVRKDPSRKFSRDSGDITFCSQLQKDLLRKGAENLREDGVLLYVTCSLEPEEDEMVADWALQHLPLTIERVDFTVNGIPAAGGIDNPFGVDLSEEIRLTRRIYPHVHDSNGMFVAKFRKAE